MPTEEQIVTGAISAESGGWLFTAGVTATTPSLQELGALVQAGLAAGASKLRQVELQEVEVGPQDRGSGLTSAIVYGPKAARIGGTSAFGDF
ncbi:MAG TPA: hypothetical protein VKS22_10915 [Candidatus Binataceae bacterium]|nr:hypothetical protein [Candidatus Binataceae bacterium]